MSEEMKLSATLELKDKMTATLDKGVSGFKKMSETAKGFKRTIDDTTKGVDKFKSSADGIKSDYSTSFKLKDWASNNLRRIKTELSGISGKVYTATVAVRQAGMEKLRNAGNSVMASTVGTGLQMGAAAGIGFGVMDSVNTFKSFEQQMKRVQGISGASADDFERLSVAARKAGADTQFSATESAKALEYMAMAGWKTEESINALPGVLSLAAASGEDLAQVSDIVTDAMTAFHMQASQAGEFADVLAVAATNSNTNVGKMGYTFKYVAPLAGALGYSVQDMAVGIGAMADAGIKGEQAGTSLRSLLTNLAAPTKTSGTAMDQLGISMTDAEGRMKSFRTLMTDLRTAFKGLTKEQKAQYASMLAGQEGMSGLIAIVDKDENSFNRLVSAIDNAKGKSDEMSKIMNDNFAGDLKQLSSKWDEFILTLFYGRGGKGPGAQLRNIVQEAISVVDEFTESVKKNGFGFTSVKDLIWRVVKDTLKAVYQFDGSIGSILATGTTMVALKKMYNVVKKIRDITKSGFGGKLPGTGGGLPGTGVGEMNVQAAVVNVYGGNSGAGAPDVPIPEKSSPAKTPPASKAPSRWGKLGGFLGKNAGKIGLAAAIGYGVYDVATSDDKERAFSRNAGGIAGGIVGAKGGAIVGGAIGSAFGGVGAAPGALIGGAIGGIAGYMGGASLGDDLGQNLDGIKNKISTFSEETKTMFSGWGDSISAVVSPVFDGIKTNFEDKINFVVGLGATVWDMVSPYWSAFADWTDANVFSPISQFASNTWDGITSTASVAWDTVSSVASDAWGTIKTEAGNAWNGITELWAPAGAWFDANVWQPIVGFAGSAATAVSNAFNAGIGWIKSAWSGLTSWFDSTIWGPLKNKIDNAGAWISGIEARGAKVTGLSGSTSTKGKALGTSYFVGGLTRINEHGEEIIDLPSGTRIYPHSTTKRMIQQELGHNAMGTTYWRGGSTVINERGGEMLDIPGQGRYIPGDVITSLKQSPLPTRAQNDVMASSSMTALPTRTQMDNAQTATASNAIQRIINTQTIERKSGNTIAPQVTVTGNTFVVREEADIDKIAHALVQLFTDATGNYGGAY